MTYLSDMGYGLSGAQDPPNMDWFERALSKHPHFVVLELA
jgi:hypothetical protein